MKINQSRKAGIFTNSSSNSSICWIRGFNCMQKRRLTVMRHHLNTNTRKYRTLNHSVKVFIQITVAKDRRKRKINIQLQPRTLDRIPLLHRHNYQALKVRNSRIILQMVQVRQLNYARINSLLKGK
jgi:hypothetical protein